MASILWISMDFEVKIGLLLSGVEKVVIVSISLITLDVVGLLTFGPDVMDVDIKDPSPAVFPGEPSLEKVRPKYCSKNRSKEVDDDLSVTEPP